MSAIQLIETYDADSRNPNSRKLLRVCEEALAALKNFSEPLRVVALAGEMGVGKSKIASLLAFVDHYFGVRGEGRRVPPSSRGFHSSNGASSNTKGIWMWSEPLKPASGVGSVLLLDCEGMGSNDPLLCGDLYLLSLLISSTFTVVLRPPRFQGATPDAIHQALLRAKALQLDVAAVMPEVVFLTCDAVQLRVQAKDPPMTSESYIKGLLDYCVKASPGMASFVTLFNRVLPKKKALPFTSLPVALIKEEADEAGDQFDYLRRQLPSDNARLDPDWMRDLVKLRAVIFGGEAKGLPGAFNNVKCSVGELVQLITKIATRLNQTKSSPPLDIFAEILATRAKEKAQGKLAEALASLLSFAVDQVISNIKEVETKEQAARHDSSLENLRQTLAKDFEEVLRRYIASELAYLQVFSSGKEDPKLPVPLETVVKEGLTSFNNDKAAENSIKEHRSAIALKIETERVRKMKEAKEAAEARLRVQELEAEKHSILGSYPLEVSQEKHFGGFRMHTTVRINRDGRVDCHTNIYNCAALVGHRGRVAVYLRDKAGNNLEMKDGGTYGVDGEYVPFTGPHERDILWGFIVPESMLLVIRQVGILHLRGDGPNPLEMIRRNAEEIGKTIEVLKGVGKQIGM